MSSGGSSSSSSSSSSSRSSSSGGTDSSHLLYFIARDLPSDRQVAVIITIDNSQSTHKGVN